MDVRADEARTPGGRAACWALLALCAAVLALTRWNTLAMPFIRDEGEYAYSAWLMSQGLAPYVHAFVQKPPLILHIFRLGLWLSDGAPWGPRLLALGAMALSAGLLGRVLARRHGAPAGLAAALFLLCLLALPNLFPYDANCEVFMIAGTLGFLALAEARGGDAGWGWWLAGGGLFAATLLCKPNALPPLAAILAWWAWQVAIRRGRWQEVARRLAWFGIGAAWATALALAPLGLGDGLFRLFECVVVFNRFYVANYDHAHMLATHLGIEAAAWWPAFGLALWGLVRRPRAAAPWVGLYLLALAVAALGSGGRSFSPTAPFLAAGAALGLYDLAGLACRHRNLGQRAALVALAAAVLGLVLLLPSRSALTLSPARLVDFGYGRRTLFADGPLLAGKLAEHTRDTDRVFVAGSQPQVLYGARRLSATRFITMYQVMFPTPLTGHYQEEIVHDLEANPPAAILFFSLTADWCYLYDTSYGVQGWLSRQLSFGAYRRVGGYLPADVGGDWVEPLDEETARRAVVTLFVREPALSDGSTSDPRRRG